MSVAPEDVQNQCGSVDDLDLEGVFQVALLGRCELIVEDHDLRIALGRLLFDLLNFPLAQVGVSEPVGSLGDLANDLGASCPG